MSWILCNRCGHIEQKCECKFESPPPPNKKEAVSDYRFLTLKGKFARNVEIEFYLEPGGDLNIEIDEHHSGYYDSGRARTVLSKEQVAQLREFLKEEVGT